MKFTNALGGCANCGALTRSATPYVTPLRSSSSQRQCAHNYLPCPPDVNLCITVLAGGRALTTQSTSAMLVAAGKSHMPDTHTGSAADNRPNVVHSSTVMAIDKQPYELCRYLVKGTLEGYKPGLKSRAGSSKRGKASKSKPYPGSSHSDSVDRLCSDSPQKRVRYGGMSVFPSEETACRERRLADTWV